MMDPIKFRNEPAQSEATVPADPAADQPAWEMIEAGRYMPRRIRGSCHGRELG